MKFRSVPQCNAADAQPSRGRRVPLAIGAVLSAVVLAACSSTGGKPADTGGGGGAGGGVNTPRITVAMITHEVPGDSFWDLIRKGAEAAADKDNIELRYSNDPEAPNQANLVQSAIDSKVAGHRGHAGQAGCDGAGGEGGAGGGHPGGRLQLRLRQLQGAWACRQYFGQDEKLAGIAAGEKLNADGAKKVTLRHPGAGPGRARIPLRRRHRRASRAVRPRCSTSTARTCRRWSRRSPPSCSRTRAIDHVVTLGAPIALTAVQSKGNARQQGQDRHLRHQRRAGRRHQERRGAVGRRPAALPAGLPRDRLAVALHQQQEPDRRRPADADRAVVHRPVQHRSPWPSLAKAGTR